MMKTVDREERGARRRRPRPEAATARVALPGSDEPAGSDGADRRARRAAVHPGRPAGARSEPEARIRGQQVGQPRKVSFEIRARAIGPITERSRAAELGDEHGFAGFLGAQRNGRGIVFHVTESTDRLVATPIRSE